MAKIKTIGIIAEDHSDFETLKVLITRAVNNDKLTFKKAISNGCGKLRRKCNDYAKNLADKGCSLLIVAHDLDRNNHQKLKESLELKLRPNPFKHYFICIPIEEIESWFLSDPDHLKQFFSLKLGFKIKGNPETIASPKEYLEDMVYTASGKERVYVNTKHNVLLAAGVSLAAINKKCKSFSELQEFLTQYSY